MEKEKHNTNKIEFYFSPFIWIITIIIIPAGYFDKYFLAYFCMMLHESGHILASLIFKKRIRKIRFLLIGINASIELEDSNIKKRTIILLSGPFTNLFFSITGSFFIAGGLKSNNINYFIVLNLYLFIFNLLPVIPLDGGELLKSILRNNLGMFLGSTYLRKISYCFSGVLILIGIMQMTSKIYNFSLIFIGVYTFLNLKSVNLEAAIMNMKLIMYRRERVLKRGIYGARALVAIKSIKLGEILKSMDYDSFHFIYVLDENLKLLKIFSEQELIDGMLEYSTEITLLELIEKTEAKVRSISLKDKD